MQAQCQEDQGEVRDPWLRRTLMPIFLHYSHLAVAHLAMVFQMPFPVGTAIIRSPCSTNLFSILDEDMPGFSSIFTVYCSLSIHGLRYFCFYRLCSNIIIFFPTELSWCQIVCLFILHLCKTLQGSESVVLDWNWVFSCRSCCCYHGFNLLFIYLLLLLLVLMRNPGGGG